MRHLVHCWAMHMGNCAFAAFLERAGSDSCHVRAALRVTFCLDNGMIWHLSALSLGLPTPVPFWASNPSSW